MLSCDKHLREMGPNIGVRGTEKKRKGGGSVERMGADILEGSREVRRDTKSIATGMNVRG